VGMKGVDVSYVALVFAWKIDPIIPAESGSPPRSCSS
jgi:hypothetical protein